MVIKKHTKTHNHSILTPPPLPFFFSFLFYFLFFSTFFYFLSSKSHRKEGKLME